MKVFPTGQHSRKFATEWFKVGAGAAPADDGAREQFEIGCMHATEQGEINACADVVAESSAMVPAGLQTVPGEDDRTAIRNGAGAGDGAITSKSASTSSTKVTRQSCTSIEVSSYALMHPEVNP